MRTLDIREIPPKNRHRLIFESFDALKEDEALILITDHDPKPLYYQFEAEKKGLFVWDTISGGPETWEVTITRLAHLPTVGEITRDYPGAMEVFNRENIDYCCQGDRPFDAVATAAGFTPKELLEMIRTTPTTGDRLNYAYWSPAMTCEFIEMNHHQYVKMQLPKISELSEKVLHAHGETHEWLSELHKRIQTLDRELRSHMEKEEVQLFPAIRQLTLEKEISQEDLNELLGSLREEHDEAGTLMKEIREITSGYTPPADSCMSFRQLYDWLEDFEKDLFAHVHLENNILFKKVSNPGDWLKIPDEKHPT